MGILEIPNEGQVGELKMKMFRGTKSEQNHLEYTSDPGNLRGKETDSHDNLTYINLIKFVIQFNKGRSKASFICL
ncbi:hypothetical protein BA768_18815 [Chryseobacterium sp. CBo1]|uniref:Uncharacterized protein n=1 Tax=Candidatus Chryseobacterium massiliense TaxID=204089 RepID=A0A3D9B0N3_9FLAO|nr:MULTISPECIES: hypothetical protein [Chryseobacterium]OCK50771.1 hypothetical protein BA768_18815 [Chryseobacterium sp. CBo1]REC46918.1 hypothetical protein DRF68_13785 [Candidatus Chryseobacterium massiliae]